VRRSLSQLILTFFGLTFKTSSLYRKSLFTEIHEILFHGKGGYDYNTIYNMPIWLRKFTFNKLKEWYNTENQNPNEDSWVKGAAKEEASKNKQVKVPTYVTKASKK
jgi:hypothetical protein